VFHQVSLSVYWLYIKSLGVALSCGMFAFFLLSQVSSICSNVWLSEWTSDPLLMNTTISNTSQFADRQNLFLGVYGALSGAQGTMLHSVDVIVNLVQVTADEVVSRRRRSVFSHVRPIDRSCTSSSDLSVMTRRGSGQLGTWKRLRGCPRKRCVEQIIMSTGFSPSDAWCAATDRSAWILRRSSVKREK